MTTSPWTEKKPTAVLVFADGTVVRGHGVGATGEARAEVCFNTALTGYQEILTDPSYLGQIVTFTFPHIGNIGANEEDIEDLTPAAHIGAVGVILKADITEPSNYRSAGHFDAWLKARGIVGLSGVDTRALTAWIRENGAPNAVIAHDPSGEFDIEALTAKAAEWSGLEGLDLARDATSGQSSSWTQAPWVWSEGFGETGEPVAHIVAIDYGVKRNILRLFSGLGCKVTVVPATMSAEDILAMAPDGVFLSNGPGDPAATGEYAVPVIRKLIDSGHSDFRHLPWPPDPGAGARRHHGEDAPGPSRRQPPGQGSHHRQGRDRVDEPRLCGRCQEPARRCRGDPRLAVRRLQLRSAAGRKAGVLGPASPGSLARPAGQPLSVPPLHEHGR
jgi:carbamoyl-phosphate synthase small subunit